jgi:hypothetical protein
LVCFIASVSTYCGVYNFDLIIFPHLFVYYLTHCSALYVCCGRQEVSVPQAQESSDQQQVSLEVQPRGVIENTSAWKVKGSRFKSRHELSYFSLTCWFI